MQPIFIGGTGRSGTMILKRIFSRHSQIVSLPDELRIIVDPGGALDLIQALSVRWSPYTADISIHRFCYMVKMAGKADAKSKIILEKAIRRMLSYFNISGREYLGGGFRYYFGKKYYPSRLCQLLGGLTYHQSRGSWTGSPAYQFGSKIFESGPLERSQVQQMIARFFMDLYQQLAKKGETHWLDDTPSNLLYANELFQLFPQMKLLHIYRDPRDVVASYRRFKWGGDSYKVAATRLSGIYKRWFQVRGEMPKGLYFEVSLEALTENPYNILNEICTFLKIPFENQLLDIPLNRANSGRWNREISDLEMEGLGKILAPYIEAFGYDEYPIHNDAKK